jgi:RNA-directed DNA polymerase
MKRYGHLYAKICDLDNIMQAHRSARRGKAHYREVRIIDADQRRYALSLRNMLMAHEYRTSPYKVFRRMERGKEREISVLPYYPDRIVQWAIMRVLEPVWTPTLISHTYSSIKGRGVHRGLQDLRRALRDEESTRYCLKLDVRKFYPSLDRAVLKRTLRRKLKDAETLALLDGIIDSAPGKRGVPIGNYLSQYFGNLYLSGLDHWLKESKHVGHYFRYCDDLVLLGPDKAELHQLRRDIEAYLRDELRLELKDNWQVFPTRVRGIDFLGYRSFGDRTLLRESTARRMKAAMRGIMERGWDETARGQVASYRGWMQWCDADGLEERYVAPAAALGGMA